MKYFLLSMLCHLAVFLTFLLPLQSQPASLTEKPSFSKLSVSIKKVSPKVANHQSVPNVKKTMSPRKSKAKVQQPKQLSKQSEDFLEKANQGNSQTKALISKNYAPEYPELAKELRQEGTVVLAAEVLTEGSVGAVKVIHSSGYKLLDDAAVDALKTWQYYPAQEKGQAVISWLEQPIRFQLNH